MNNQKLDDLASWARLLELLNEAPAELAAQLERERTRQALRAASAEAAVSAIGGSGDIVHIHFGVADHEGSVVDGTDVAWCAVQADEESGYSWRIDIPEGGMDGDSLNLLAAIALDRPAALRSTDNGSVMLRYADDELPILAKDLAALVARVETLQPHQQLDSVLWEADEQPDNFPHLRDLPYATSSYAED